MFKVGDKVKIRTDLVPNELYDSLEFRNEMMEFCGREAEIIEVDEDGDYRIDLDEESWFWNDEMFEDEVSDDAKFRAFLEEVACGNMNEYSEPYDNLYNLVCNYMDEENVNATIDYLCDFYKDFKSNAPRKMTVAEIEKELGYKIEVVK
jgi:sulfur relay (sulfurtransferase) DsrC/TusE family protein